MHIWSSPLRIILFGPSRPYVSVSDLVLHIFLWLLALSVCSKHRLTKELNKNFFRDGVRSGSSDRPRSMYMMCPGDVGRDSGEWGGQESEVLQDWKSHQELGEEALAEGAVLGVGTECPKVLSDCCCCCCCCCLCFCC